MIRHRLASWSTTRRSICPSFHQIQPWHSRPNVPKRRSLSIDTLTTILLPPAVFGGLLISLWTYKCLMMVIFQNKIIYMPSVPPFSRSEKVEQYAAQCRPICWEEHAIFSTDGTRIKLLEGQSQSSVNPPATKHVVVLYLQGNASSLPPRLPFLSKVIQSAYAISTSRGLPTKYTCIALSYRGFWTSEGRPSQAGIEKDVQAALDWLFERYSEERPEIVIWGQSIGAGAASVGLFNLLQHQNGMTKLRQISGLVLETPFTNLRAMLIALYPQKFLPYRYLTPFLRSTWDSKIALAGVTKAKTKLNFLILEAGNDELVPQGDAAILRDICRNSGAQVRHIVVSGALHTDVMLKVQGRQEIAQFLASTGSASETAEDIIRVNTLKDS